MSETIKPIKCRWEFLQVTQNKTLVLDRPNAVRFYAVGQKNIVEINNSFRLDTDNGTPFPSELILDLNNYETDETVYTIKFDESVPKAQRGLLVIVKYFVFE